MESITKNQHYVPQFILNNWAIKEQIWTLNKGTNKIFKTNIENMCSKNYLYDIKSPFGGLITKNEYEKRFAKYEGEVADYIRDLISIFDLNTTDALIVRKEEREKLLNFAISIATRSPKMIEYFVERTDISKEMPDLINEFYEFINSFTQIYDTEISKDECEKMLNKLNGLRAIAPEDKDNITLGLFNKFVGLDFKNGYAYILKNENETFFANDMFSITVITETNSKIIYMPLSPKYYFIYSIEKMNFWNKNKINIVDDDYCYWLINNTSYDCNFIFSSSKEKLEELINSK